MHVARLCNADVDKNTDAKRTEFVGMLYNLCSLRTTIRNVVASNQRVKYVARLLLVH